MRWPGANDGDFRLIASRRPRDLTFEGQARPKRGRIGRCELYGLHELIDTPHLTGGGYMGNAKARSGARGPSPRAAYNSAATLTTAFVMDAGVALPNGVTGVTFRTPRKAA